MVKDLFMVYSRGKADGRKKKKGEGGERPEAGRVCDERRSMGRSVLAKNAE